MFIKRALALGFITGGFYVAGCGGTTADIGDSAPAGAAGSSGKPGGSAGAGNAPSGAGSTSKGGSSSEAGGTAVGGSSAGQASGGESGHASGGGATSGGASGSAGNGSAGAPNCATKVCPGAVTACKAGQAIVPSGSCCQSCVCPMDCATTVLPCPAGQAPQATDPNICCPAQACGPVLTSDCNGKKCGDTCGQGEFPAFCDQNGSCNVAAVPTCN